MKALFVSILALFMSVSLSARGLTTEEKLQDFNQLKSLIHAEYGPLQYKAEHKIMDLPALNVEFEKRIIATKTNQEFYSAMMEYVAAFRDGHFGLLADTDREAAIPLNTDLIGGKVLISAIDREKLPESAFPFQLGDEIVKVDGVDVQTVLDIQSRPLASGNLNSVRRKAAWTIAARNGKRYPLPTAKQVVLSIRHGETESVEDVAIDWVFKGEEGDENHVTPGFESFLTMPMGKSRVASMKEARVLDTNIYRNHLIDSSYACNGGTRVHVPEDAVVLLKEPFVAYVYPTEKGMVGYVRIPDYYPTDAAGQFTADALRAWYEKLRFVLLKMEISTVGLVIDQDHNCGGSVDLVENVIGLFMSEPVRPMVFQLRANKATYLSMKNEMALLTADTIEYAYYGILLGLVENTWKNTNDFMTPFTPISGREWVFPDGLVTYTKPVVILIDEMAGSGGDAFPSMMKDYGRAKLFGQQTSGLGGSVNEFGALYNSRMTVRMTVSLFFKPNGEPVENNGAVPDQYYSLTREDLMTDYKPYQKAYTEYLLQQIPDSSQQQ